LYAYNSICILTIQKNASKPSRPAPASPPPLPTRFSPRQLLRHFHQLLPALLLADWLLDAQQTFYRRAFTPLITLWYLVFQRLSDNHHLSHIQDDAREGGADRLSPRAKKLSAQITSECTSSYSDARQRLPLAVCRQALWHIGQQFARSFQWPHRLGLRTVLLDGSTFRLRPFGDIPKEFPPHRPGNCKRDPYWCVVRVVGLLCLATGAVLDSAVGCLRTSEQVLSAALLRARCWAECLLIGDRNFGVYSIARSIVAAQGHALLRLTQVRAANLARAAQFKLKPGLDASVTWHPSRYDQCPEGLVADPVPGRLLVWRIHRPGFRSFTLYLFTTLVDRAQYPALELVQLYGERWNIEVCFRYIKAQMELGFLECYSAQMAQKEWFAGLIAYNLIRWTMAAAAAKTQMPVGRISFSRARELLLGWLARSPLHRRSQRSWTRLLTRVSKVLLLRRRKKRPAEPRAVRPFRKDHLTLVGSRAAARKRLAQSHSKS
jgi:hypothetical protein